MGVRGGMGLMDRSRRRAASAAAAALLFLAAGAELFAGGAREASTARGLLPVVAAENFWGDIAAQIGGAHVAVTSILSDPNIDPHEYESNVRDAIAVADSHVVVENGGGYDGWMDKLLSASPNRDRIVLAAYELAVTRLPDNEHVWYDPGNAAATARAMRDAFARLDPANASDYDRNLAAFDDSLGAIRRLLAEIKAKYAGSPIALTETILLYQTIPAGLDVLTPFEFEKAIAEGNDPPAAAAVAAENQLLRKQVRVLIYNDQTVDPLTKKLRSEAATAGIPVVPVTETMPKGEHYQSWMTSQLELLLQALGG